MRMDIVIDKKLKEIFRRNAELLDYEWGIEPQVVIHLKLKRLLKDLKDPQWIAIDRKVQANGGCWDSMLKEWMLPNFVSPINLPALKEKQRSRLYIHDKTLHNLLDLRGVFRGRRIESWRDIQKALDFFRPNRPQGKFSKSACRDYLGALRALQPEPAQA